MNGTTRILSIFTLLIILTLSLAGPVQAFDGQTGEDIVIKSDEVVFDDLYIIANDFYLDGTVTGDLVVFGAIITINGAVQGDLIAAGPRMVINGSVTDDVRVAGTIVQVGNVANLGDALVVAGAVCPPVDQGQVRLAAHWVGFPDHHCSGVVHPEKTCE
ncbi:MAG: hypothetical protein H8D34_06725 [Chloroflexi bacterium]|nr:hypothetical protein [Chloroflexota bacterium]